MLKWLALFLVSFPSLVTGQEHRSRNTSIGIMLSTDISYRYLNYQPAFEWFEKQRDVYEQPAISFSGGACLRIDLNTRLKLYTGISYKAFGFDTELFSLNWPSSSDRFPHSFSVQYRFKFVEVPLRLQYFFYQKNRFSLYGTIGMSESIFIRKTIKNQLKFAKGKTEVIKTHTYGGHSRVNHFGYAGVGFSLRISTGLCAVVEPGFEYSLSSIVVHPDAREHLYAFRVQAGIIKRLYKNKNRS